MTLNEAGRSLPGNFSFVSLSAAFNAFIRQSSGTKNYQTLRYHLDINMEKGLPMTRTAS